MEETCVLRPIAHVHSEFPGKFGIPRQSGVVPELRSELIFTPEFRNPDALRGIEGFDRLWLIWEFSANRRASWSPTVRPPRLGGNTRLGVFATRSPAEPARHVLRRPDRRPAGCKARACSVPVGGRSHGRHARVRHQAVSSLF